MKLPKKIKTKWLRALRSGTYKQTKGRLYNPETAGFCCLGVLQHCTTGGMVEVHRGVELGNEFLAMPTVKWLTDIGAVELDNEAPGAKWGQNYLSKLADLNDRSRKGFKYIADWIEKNIQTTD